MAGLSSPEISSFLAVAHELADLSAREILPFFRSKISVEDKQTKPDFDPVTVADQNAERVIRDYLSENFKNHSVVGEEFGLDDKSSDYCWFIDPIDGTSSFIIGQPVWGTLIGLSYQETPVIGLMNQPYTNERFWASFEGAYGRWQDSEYPLLTAQRNDLSEAIITTTSPDLFANEDDLRRFNILRQKCKMTRYGGDCYNYCLLAKGQIDLIVESGLQPFDILPLVPIIKNAGGIISDWSGNELNAGGQVIAAGNEKLHKAAIEILAAAQG